MNYNDQCPKCLHGYMALIRYNPVSTETKPQDPGYVCLSTCPTTEHLHLRCNACWYFEAQEVAAA